MLQQWWSVVSGGGVVQWSPSNCSLVSSFGQLVLLLLSSSSLTLLLCVVYACGTRKSSRFGYGAFTHASGRGGGGESERRRIAVLWSAS